MQYKYYAELAAAIILEARQEYLKNKALVDDHPECRYAARECRDLYKFFHSEWFSDLVIIAGETLHIRLDAGQYDEKNKNVP